MTACERQAVLIAKSNPRIILVLAKVNLDFASTGYVTPWGDQGGELRLSPLETPSLRPPRQDRGE